MQDQTTAVRFILDGTGKSKTEIPVYKSLGQLPPFEDYAMKGRTYRYFQGEPLYGFGFGQGYSKFEYSGLRTRRTANGATVTARVRNVSSV